MSEFIVFIFEMDYFETRICNYFSTFEQAKFWILNNGPELTKKFYSKRNDGCFFYISSKTKYDILRNKYCFTQQSFDKVIEIYKQNNDFFYINTIFYKEDGTIIDGIPEENKASKDNVVDCQIYKSKKIKFDLNKYTFFICGSNYCLSNLYIKLPDQIVKYLNIKDLINIEFCYLFTTTLIDKILNLDDIFYLKFTTLGGNDPSRNLGGLSLYEEISNLCEQIENLNSEVINISIKIDYLNECEIRNVLNNMCKIKCKFICGSTSGIKCSNIADLNDKLFCTSHFEDFNNRIKKKQLKRISRKNIETF